ncbi:MAG: hypothetical protein AAGK04_08020 [Planctomycetota bacterium]
MLLRALLLGSIGLAIVGCASTPSEPVVRVPAGQYAEAFDAARQAVRFYGFKLERVDAADGVLTTRAKETSGLATPWDLEQSSLEDEWLDFANAHRRRVRVTFAPEGAIEPDDPRSQAAPGVAPGDLRLEDGPVRAEFEVTLERVQRPLWRVPTVSARRASFARDPLGEARGLRRGFGVAVTQDRGLAGRLADRVRDAINSVAPSDDS